MKNKILINCPFCKNDVEVNGDRNWKNFFSFGVVGGFWELIFFSLKISIFCYVVVYFSSMAIVSVLVLNETGIIERFCNK